MSNKNVIKVCGVVLICLIFYYYNKIFNNKDIIYVENVETNNLQEENLIDVSEVTVYVSGEVNKSGVYKVKPSLRTIDVIELAGGVTATADISTINLAEIVYDEQHILIPEQQDEEQIIITDKINLNSASLEQLIDVTHIGEVTAEKIITYREEKGAFMSVGELKNIDGIGDKTFVKIKNSFIVE